MAAPYKEGQRVKTAEGIEGTIRFVGDLAGKPGKFVGVELDEPVGKNSGNVGDTTYFECRPNHGIFYPHTAATTKKLDILKEPVKVASANGKPVGGATKSRPSTVAPALRPRPSVVGTTSRTASSTASPTPGTSLGSRRTSTAPSASAAPTATRAARPSLAPGRSSPLKPVTAPRLSTVGAASARSIRSPPAITAATRTSGRSTASPTKSDEATTAPPATHSRQPSNPISTAPSSAARLAELQASKKKIEDKKVDDHTIKELEKTKAEREQFKVVNEKLGSKCKVQSEEIARLRQLLVEKEKESERLERQGAEHDTFMESAVLDKEMAEEREEATRFELQNIKQNYEALQERHAQLQELQNELDKDLSPEERASKNWVLMQRENERLRDALIYLRDRAQDTETDLKIQIEELEADSEELELIKNESEDIKAQLLDAEAQVQDLREQLEVAEGAEAMIEQLSDQNATMGEKIEELQGAVEDLQNLKELHDEIEESYNEQVKELEEIINGKDTVLGEQERQTVQQREELEDKEYTISRFRDLVADLQAGLDDMRASKELTETQASDLENHHRTMMDFNRQLQASATSHQLKTIDLELRRMEAEVAQEHLSILQMFLPEAIQSEQGSILALSGFRRILSKSRLIHTLLKETITNPGPQTRVDSILSICDALDKLTWLSATSERFIRTISSCSPEKFQKFGGASYEIEPVERTLNNCLEAVKKNDVRGEEVVDGLQRSMAVLKHLSAQHFDDELADYAQDVLVKTLMTQSALENTAIALMATKKEVQRAVSSSEQGQEDTSGFFQRAEAFVASSRGAKVIAGKLAKQLQELKSRSMTLNRGTESLFDSCAENTDGLAIGTRTLGISIFDALNTDDDQVAPGLDDVLAVFRTFNEVTFSSTVPDVWEPLHTQMQKLHAVLSQLYNTSLDLSAAVEFDTAEPPWKLQAKALLENKTTSAEVEEQIQTLTREVQERTTTIRLRDQTLEELGLKTEMLEARMKDASGKVEKMTVLERSLDQERNNAAKAQKEVEDMLQQVVKLTEDRDNWLRKAAEAQASDVLPKDGQTGAHLVGTSAEMESFKSEIAVLESTIRFLRQQVKRTRTEEINRSSGWLRTPLTSTTTNNKAAGNVETLDALKTLTTLPTTAKSITIAPSEARVSRTAWQPMRSTPQWQLSQMELNWMDTWVKPRSKRGKVNIWADAPEQLHFGDEIAV